MHKHLPNLFIFLDQYNNQIFKNNITNIGIVYRNYNKVNRETELTKIAKACKKKRYQLFVSNDVKLAMKVGAKGIYIPSFNRTPGIPGIAAFSAILIPDSTSLPLAVPVDATPIIS